MNLATGAMGSLLPKLAELVTDEYKLQKGVKESVKSLEKEMKSMHAALLVVAEVPRDRLSLPVKLWAGEVRELSFEMEDIIDKFLVRVDDDSDPVIKSSKLERLTEKMAGLFSKVKTRHHIADAIKDINKQVQEVAKRRGSYNVDNIVAMHPPVTTIDPRLGTLYKEVTDLVGIPGKRDEELMKLILEGDNDTKNKLRIVSVVGFGGLGKTTLVKTVYDKIKGDFDCKAFVPSGQNADVKKILRDILRDLGMYKSDFTDLDVRQLIDKLRENLEKKRYLIVIDDIWDEKLWTVINWAFSRSTNFGSRLMTTTRIASVSKLCCSSTNDFVYQMEPLSDYDSKRLFYKRIFFHDSGCPGEFEEVSIDILKKCGGVPLAIITIASLLASDHRVKPLEEWKSLLESIGRGLTEDPSVEEMLRILSFSYYDLPSHLKTCLLYLSMFPEDYEIKKHQLIWMWIAESFVQLGKAKTSLFEIGETYFNELVNRNMIMPVYGDVFNDIDRRVVACRVHDMVLDLISSLSSEDNFITVLNGTGDRVSSERNGRRLSLQSARKGDLKATPLESVNMLQVRSVAAFGPGIDLMPSFKSFVVLRVLDLTGCNLGDPSNLNLRDLGIILHLRYLGLADTRISKIPEEIGKLQFLQVLDLSGNDNVELPSTVIKLRRLMCLLIDGDHERLPDELGNLTSMEVLRTISCDSPRMLKELGSMERLRELEITIDNLSLEIEEAFVELLGKLSNIQILAIYCFDEGVASIDLLGESWMPPRSLQEFRITTPEIRFSTLPTWISRDPSRMWQLSVLAITLKQVQQDDLDNLGRLPALRSLGLMSYAGNGLLVVGADGFRCLTAFFMRFDLPVQIVFQPGAMPRAEKVRLDSIRVPVQVTNEEAACDGLDCFEEPVLGMGNLPSLGKVYVTFDRSGVTVREAKQAEAGLTNALRAHPNHPTFSIFIEPSIPKDALDDDVCSDRVCSDEEEE